MIKVCATADLHIGMPFTAYPHASGELVEARFEALQRIVTYSNESHVSLIIIAGDLFNSVRVSAAAIRRTAEILADYEGNLIAVLPGNHDYFSGAETQPWNLFSSAVAELRAGVLVLSDSRKYELDRYDLPVDIYAGPCSSKHSEQNAIGWISSAEGSSSEKASIGVAHGSIDGISPDFDGRYYPMRLNDFERTPNQLWIVGHTHAHRELTTREGQKLVIPGTPEPDGFDCAHEGRIWRLDIEAGKGIDTDSIEIGSYRFLATDASLEGSADLEPVSRTLESLSGPTTLIRLRASGVLNPDEFSEFRRWCDRMGERFISFDVDDSELFEAITLDRIKTEYTVDSFPYRLLVELLEADDQPALQTAYRYLQKASKLERAQPGRRRK